MDFRRSLRNAGQMRVEQKESSGCCACLVWAGAICTVLVTILLLLSIVGLGIAKLVMGGIYFHDCELEPLVPIFLIVDACVAIGLGCRCRIGGGGESGDDPSLGTKILQGIVGLFQLAWLICGTIWVVNVRDVIYSPGHCDSTITTTAATIVNTTTTAAITTSLPVNASSIISSSSSSNSSILLSALKSTSATAECLTCSSALVDFTFGIVIFQWILMGMVFMNVCFAIAGLCRAKLGS